MRTSKLFAPVAFTAVLLIGIAGAQARGGGPIDPRAHGDYSALTSTRSYESAAAPSMTAHDGTSAVIRTAPGRRLPYWVTR